ncbi:MAG TPA: glycosyltransferase family 39 protein [Acidobacteriota bacterium]|nr:glycosyltransferase family 39 protein [Acidobacteriota bacterium]
MRLQIPWMHAFLLLAISLPYFVNLGTSSLWDASEAFYAETPREMLASGDYVAPHFNFAPRVQKPPLAYWIIALSYQLFGIGEFAVRLPGALAGIGVILFTYGIARLLYSPRAALMAAAMTATTARIFILARRLPIDIFLLFFLIGTLFFLVHAIRLQKTHWWIAAYFFAALGFLTKGPVAVIIPAVAVIAWAFIGRRLKAADFRFLPGAAVFAAVVLPWYLLVYYRHGWTYIAPFFLRDNLGRFASEDFGPSRGLLYYFGVGISDFFPWSILALCACGVLWRCRKTEHPFRSLEYGLPILWCAFTFLLFSLSKNKQEYYIAPIYPVAAVLMAGVLDKMIERQTAKSGTAPRTFQQAPLSWCFWGLGLQALLLSVFSLSTFYIFRFFMPEIAPLYHNIASLVLVAGCGAFVWSIARRRLAPSLIILTALLWIMYLMCVTVYLPGLERYRPVKGLCRLIEAQRDADAEAGYFRTAVPSMAFYLRRPIFEESNAIEMRRRLRSGKRVFCILSRKSYDSLISDSPDGIYILARQPRFSMRMDAFLNTRYAQEEELLLISNRPAELIGSAGDRATS